MTHLKYYKTEREIFAGEFSEKPQQPSKSIPIIIKKLYRHYKLGQPILYLTSGSRHSRCGGRHITINIDDGSYATIAHEVAHALDFMKRNLSKHDKKHRTKMRRILAYMKKKDYFKAEITRRLAEKPPMPEPTETEIFQKKTEALKQKIIHYEKKSIFYQKKMKKATAKLNRKLAWQKRKILEKPLMNI